MAERGKAYRFWINHLKYISRVNRNLYYWTIKDESVPNGWRHAKNWKELDADPESKVKLYKKTSRFWRAKWKQIESHQKIKRTRKESKDLENNALKGDMQ
jgi:hypothetical protein